MPTLDELTTIFADHNASTPEEAVKLAIQVYKAARAGEVESQAPWQRLRSQAKAIVDEVFTELNITRLNTPAGNAYIPADGVSVRYDAKALDRLCLEHPDFRDLLWPHRSETQRPGHLTIR